MRASRAFALSLSLAAATVVTACSDGEPRRVIQISQSNDACSPLEIGVRTGEKVKFEIKNESSKDREVEGIEGTKLEEVLVPAGKTRSVNYTAPKQEGTQKLKCYTPGGASTIIEVTVGAAVPS